MNNKQLKTLQLIFKKPIPANIKWSDIETLFVSLGAMLKEGNGSRIGILLNGVKATFHRPHPNPDAHQELVKDVRQFLQSAGVHYDDL